MKRMNWKTAKTYADAPHEYVLANEHPETYRRFSQLLKQAGVIHLGPIVYLLTAQ
jgi:hypothetical protein